MREFDLDLYVVHLLFTSSTPSPSRLSQLQEPQKNVSHITLLFLYANNIYDILIDIAGVYTDQGTARPRLPANKQQANADEARSLFVNIPGRHQHHHLLPMRMWWRKYRGTTHCQCYMRSRLGIGERYTVFHWNVEESLEIHMPRSSLSLNHLRP